MKIKKRSTLMSFASFAGLLITCTQINAASITILNPSFEVDVLANPGDSSSVPITSWSDLSGDPGYGRTSTSQFTGTIPDGVNYVYTNFAADSLGQILTTSLQANSTYTLTVAIGWRKDLPGLGYPNFPGYGIELWAGATKLASTYNTDFGASSPASDQWIDVTATYTSPLVVSADLLEIRLLAGANVNINNSAIQTGFDNVRLDSTLIPEPSTILLSGLGTLLLLRRRR